MPIFLAEEWSKISDPAKNLVSALLTYDPAKRPSAKEALNDPWIQSQAPNNQINNNLLKNIQTFYVKQFNYNVEYNQMAECHQSLHCHAGLEQQRKEGPRQPIQSHGPEQ
jgi:serine/threonine protein kinase